jgi:hypothetical protein
MFGRFTIVARILGRPMFFVQKMAGVKISEHFFRNKSCLSPVPKESDRLLNPFKPLPVVPHKAVAEVSKIGTL